LIEVNADWLQFGCKLQSPRFPSQKEDLMAFRSLLPSVFGAEGRDPFRDLQRQIDRVFSEFSQDFRPMGFGRGNGNMLAVDIDVAETDKALEISADLPGVAEKDIDVSVSDNMLTIKAEKKSERDEKGKDFRIVERSYGTFQRSMTLPFAADASKVEAKFDKGVLKLTLPKPPELQSKAQKIPVKSAA
jgi:HSP20 family protein